MPRSRKGLTRTPIPVPSDLLPDPNGDVWGAEPEEPDEDEDEDEAEGDLGAPPPPPSVAQAEKARPAPAQVLELGAPPDDTVAAAKWAYQLQMRLAHEAMTDPEMSPSQRRKEVRVTLAGAAKHMMDALRYDVVETIRKEREELERKKRGRAVAKTQKRDAPPPDGAKIIPIRRDG